MGGYSCVNTRVGFDTKIFLKDSQNEKVLFETTEGKPQRLSAKIIKMDENNQYGMAMTKIHCRTVVLKERKKHLILKNSNSCYLL